jgi:hypothetical protein
MRLLSAFLFTRLGNSCGQINRHGRQGGTVVERYQGGVAHRSAEAAASWWRLLSEDAVSEARAAASSGGKRSRSVRAVHAALSSSGGTVVLWQFLFEWTI